MDIADLLSIFFFAMIGALFFGLFGFIIVFILGLIINSNHEKNLEQKKLQEELIEAIKSLKKENNENK